MPRGGVLGSARRGWRRMLGLWVSVVAAAGVVPLAVAAPVGDDRIIGSAQFSVAFFATILTGEAVIFALAFSASSAWPSLREIDAHIAFRAWVVVGWLGAMLLGAGLLVDDRAVSTAGAVLFLLADVLGIFSFIRLFGLASAEGRKRLLSRTLARRLDEIREPVAAMAGRITTDEVLVAYLRELDASVAAGDGNSVRDRIEELTSAAVNSGVQARAAVHLEALHRLSKAALAGRLDSTVATGSAQLLIDSILAQVDADQAAAGPGALGPDRAGALAGHLGRYLAWLAATAWTLSVREVTAPGAARELVAFAVRGRNQITVTVDPDPPFTDSDAVLGSAIDSPLGVVAWIRQFVEFHGSAQANAFYPAFQLLTGTKFEGNYWDGASILSQLRQALFGPGTVVETPQADRARAAFGTAEEFDRFWTLLSVGALATLRDMTATHPPELIRPEFTPDRQLLAAYLRTYASHRYIATADEAHTVLLRLVGHAERPESLWGRSTELLRECSYPVPLPLMEPRQRMAATVLAVACRLAPLRPSDATHELRQFLNRLPPEVMTSVHRLATRVLPPGSPSAVGHKPTEDVVRRLEIIRLPTPATGEAA